MIEEIPVRSLNIHKLSVWATFSLALIGALIAMGCNPKDLSRSKAATLIEKSEEFKKPHTEEIFLGPDFRSMDFIGIGNWKVVDALLALGYLEKNGNKFVLTAKGNSAAKGWLTDPDRPNARIIPVADRKLVEVTGITTVEEVSLKEVEFTWRWVPAPIGEEIAKQNPGAGKQYDPKEVKKDKATFKLYDDGWRLDGIRF
jgi:hypothetical protein